VDAPWATTIAAGATPNKPHGPTFRGGYAGYLKDLDGHHGELASNPDFLTPD